MATTGLWKVVLTDIVKLEPPEWIVYVVTFDAVSAAQIALHVADHDLPHVRSVEYVGETVMLDERCAVNPKTRIIREKKDIA